MILIGLMSGTSADGTDAVCVRIEGAPPELHWRLLSHVSLPHPEPLRDAIFSAFRPETSRVDTLCPLHFELGEAFAQAALAACRAAASGRMRWTPSAAMGRPYGISRQARRRRPPPSSWAAPR